MAEKKLIIVESPTKAKTIKKFLGSECTIIASNGQIRTLPKNDLCIDIKNGYKPKYILDETKEKNILQMKAELKTADELILATDEDREGESISWHLIEVLKPKVPYRRMVFHEITKKAILEAFEKGRELDMNLVHAQEARRVLDRLYGYTISPVLWSKLSNKSLSAGRVQSPGLRLVVERERTRLSFQKSEYWDVKASFNEGFEARIDMVADKRVATGKDFDGETGKYIGSSKVLLMSKEQSEKIAQGLKNSTFTVSDVKEKQTVQSPAAPFITSTLQQEGNRKLHLSARDTMRIAQNLYENGFITYMRTDSPALSVEGTNGAREAVIELFGKDFVSEKPRQYAAKSSNAQEAHEAIRPAGEHFKKPEETGLTGLELELYTLIWKRTLACQMKNAVKNNTSVEIKAQCDCGKETTFTATGVSIQFPGFIRVYVEGKDDPDAALEDKESFLPKLSAGQVLSGSKLESQRHETKVPNRYTEASLVQKLEKLGIGRPSTYASIIDRLFEKVYVIREQGTLVPTFIGFGVVQLLETYFSDRIDYGFTNGMEDALDQVAEGKINELQFLKEFYEGANGLEQQVRDNKSKIVSKDVKKLNLPQLTEENSIYLGPYGPYVKSADGKFISIPEGWTPALVTNEKVQQLLNGGQTESPKANAPETMGITSDGTPVLYCSGKFGDYWQLGDKAQTAEVRRFKVPKSLIGKKNYPVEKVMEYFNLPKTIGVGENGEAITADVGKYGPYIKCGNDFRSVKDIEKLFTITEQEAREIFSQPKEKSSSSTRKATSTATATATASKTKAAANAPVVDFGEYEGKSLMILHGCYGYYLKYDDKNVRLPKECQQDEQACKALTKESVIAMVK